MMIQNYFVEIQKLMAEGRQSEALFDVEKTCSEMLNFLAIVYYDSCPQYYEKALKYLQMGRDVNPGNWMIYSNAGHILHEKGLPEQALEYAIKSLEYNELGHCDAFYNAAVILASLKKYEESIKLYRKAIAADPNKKIIYFNLGSELLGQGNFEEGWELYECRCEVFDSIKQVIDTFKAPKWNGESGKNKKIVIYSEQGAGDFIQFCRYLPKIKKKFKQVVVEVQKPLVSLIERNFEGVEVIGVENSVFNDPEGCHYSIPVCSLPRIFKANDRNSKMGKYLTPPIRKTPKELDTPKKKVGIAFAGSPLHRQDCIRSCHLKLFRPLSEMRKIQLFSLQKPISFMRTWRGKEVNLLDDIEGMSIIDLEKYSETYDDLAYLLDKMDLIISVDTSVAHLGAALGKPVWLLLPYNCDFRWKTKGVTSYWYKSIKIFRQPERDDWPSVFKMVKKQLEAVQDSL